MNMRIRIKDIAEKAGVSAGTVDRVIHKRGNVSRKAEEKVLKVLKELNYKPNIIASTLAFNKTFRIATLLPHYETDIYWEQPKAGVEKALQAVQHYKVIQEQYYFNLFDADSFVNLFDKLFENKPDAVLFAPIFLQESISLLKECERRNIPVVMINSDIEGKKALCYVGQHSYQSGVLAGKLLNFFLADTDEAMILNLGRERTNAKHVIDKERGFKEYFSKNSGKNIKVLKGEFVDFKNKARLRQFLKDQFARYPHLKGIFVINSRAYWVIDCLDKEDLKDIKIVGFDLIEPNLNYLKENKIAFLINQNSVRQGYLGIMNIVNFLVFKKQPERFQYLPLDIVVSENAEYYLKRELDYELDVV